MPCRFDPVEHDFGERLGGHAGVRRGHDLKQALFTGCRKEFHISVQQGLKRLLRLPLGMSWCQRLDAVERERKLEIDWLLAPKRTVIVECCNSLGYRHEIRSAGLRHSRDEIGD